MGRKGSQNYNRLMVSTLGLIFVILGAMSLAGAIFTDFNLGINRVWPMFLLIPVAFLVVTFIQNRKKAVGAIIPIVILTYLTVYFLAINFSPEGWGHVTRSWPHFILAPGIALLAMFILTRKWGLLIPAAILIALAIIFFGVFSQPTIVIGVMITAIGAALIIKSILDSKHKYELEEEDDDDEWDDYE